MSATGTRIPLAEAQVIAEGLLEHVNEEAYVVGSIRRKKPDVGDIEILMSRNAVIDLALGAGLFPGEWETIRGGKQGWRHWQLRNLEFGYVLDLYRFDQINRGSQMLIRTGPAGFSKLFVVNLKRHGYQHKGGYVRTNNEDEVLVSCPTEETAFKLAGMAYVEPEDRG